MQAPILEKLSEELSKMRLKNPKNGCGRKIQKQRVLSALCPSQPCSLKKKDGQVVKQVAGVHTAAIKAIVAEVELKAKAKEPSAFFFEFYSPNSAL